MAPPVRRRGLARYPPHVYVLGVRTDAMRHMPR